MLKVQVYSPSRFSEDNIEDFLSKILLQHTFITSREVPRIPLLSNSSSYCPKIS